ncbi:MAG: ParB/RepB/Spo0J family partition protein [Bacillota bacterium]
MSKKGLGRGLGALLPTVVNLEEPEQNRPQSLRVDEITPNSFQPRRQFSEEKLTELAESIKEHGIVQPIVVRALETGLYQIVAGERRWRAAQLLELEELPVIIKDYTDKQVLEIALIENIQREDLNPIEEARAYNILIEEHSLTQEELGARLGKSRSHIANTLRLLGLSTGAQGALAEGKLTAGHARALLSVPEKGQLALADKIIEEGLSVRETERIVKSLLEVKKEQGDKKNFLAKKQQLLYEDSLLAEYRDRLREKLGTKVDINQQGDKGKIVIEYYSPGDLQRVLELFFGTEIA